MVIAIPMATVSERFRIARRTAFSRVNGALARSVPDRRFTNDSSRHLSRRSKLPPMIPPLANRRERGHARSGRSGGAGEASMARWDSADAEGAAPGSSAGSDIFFDLGMRYATGQSVAIDFVTAHKWFNIAALKGSTEAIRLRREIAAEMSEDDIAAAQRAARDWLRAGEPPVDARAAA